MKNWSVDLLVNGDLEAGKKLFWECMGLLFVGKTALLALGLIPGAVADAITTQPRLTMRILQLICTQHKDSIAKWYTNLDEHKRRQFVGYVKQIGWIANPLMSLFGD